MTRNVAERLPDTGHTDPGKTDLAIAALIALIGLAMFLWRITDPAKLDFDETHYVPAVRVLIDFAGQPNPEHPPLAKYLIGIGMGIWGDNPFGWRIMSALFGALLVFAAVMAARWLFLSRPAAIMTGVLLLCSQTLFVLARIAMLDIFMASFLMLAFWMMAAGARTGLTRTRLAAAGLFLGLAIACKWTAAPLALAALIAFLILRRRNPQPGAVPLIEGLLWLGPFVALVYLFSFLPYMFLRQDAVSLGAIIPHQFAMLTLQSSPMAAHTYQSRWGQWVFDLRPIWYFYEPVAGIQRGVLFIGNPAICWGGLVALLMCVDAGLREKARPLLVPVALWIAALAFFAIIPKPVQFYYHYFVPSLLLCFAIAGALDHYLWARGRKALPLLAIGFCALVFLEFYPIISAAPLGDPQDFNRWMWLESWR